MAGGKTPFKHPTKGFGVPYDTDPHCFIVQIPRAPTGAVYIRENLGIKSEAQSQGIIDRVWLERPRWTAIRAEVQRDFNARLREYQLKTAHWVTGDNYVDRLLGRELCVLAWAIEKLSMEKIPIAVRNWMGLRPEERWWLFGMTAMNTGGVNDGDEGWRLALRYALGDRAHIEPLRPRSPSTKASDPTRPKLDLFYEDD